MGMVRYASAQVMVRCLLNQLLSTHISIAISRDLDNKHLQINVLFVSLLPLICLCIWSGYMILVLAIHLLRHSLPSKPLLSNCLACSGIGMSGHICFSCFLIAHLLTGYHLYRISVAKRVMGMPSLYIVWTQIVWHSTLLCFRSTRFQLSSELSGELWILTMCIHETPFHRFGTAVTSF